MTFQVQDGMGTGRRARVNPNNQLGVAAETNLTAHFVSVRDGLSFNLTSIYVTASAADYAAYLKNTSPTRLLFVDLVRVGAANAAVFKLASVTGTASGTTVTPQNLNLTSSSSPEATGMGNAAVTGLTQDRLLAVDRVAAGTSSLIPLDDILILGEGDAIAVEYDSGTTGQAEVVIRFYYKLRVDALDE